MEHISLLMGQARNRIILALANQSAKRCKQLWALYQERPCMFFLDEYHEELLRWNDYMGQYLGESST